jgi:hypothetical protein
VIALFNAVIGLAVFIGGCLLVAVAGATGVLDDVNGFLQEATGSPDSGLSVSSLVAGWLVTVAASVVAVTLLAVIAIAILNLVLQRVGGIDVEFATDAQPTRRATTKRAGASFERVAMRRPHGRVAAESPR